MREIKVIGVTTRELRLLLGENIAVAELEPFDKGDAVTAHMDTTQDIKEVAVAMTRFIDPGWFWSALNMLGYAPRPKITVEGCTSAQGRRLQYVAEEHADVLKLTHIFVEERAGKTFEVVMRYNPERITAEIVDKIVKAAAYEPHTWEPTAI